MAQHIQAFTIVVPDYDQGISFYCDVLGFECVTDFDLGAAKRWVLVRPQGAETSILLAKADNDAQHSSIGLQTGGRVGFFLHTDDFHTDYAHMKGSGVHFEETPRNEPYGIVAVFNDPFGNRWDLLELRT